MLGLNICAHPCAQIHSPAVGLLMPFRIDAICRTHANRWQFQIKGLHGWPCFATLETDDAGRGLKLPDRRELENLILWDPGGPPRQPEILSADCFAIPTDADAEHAPARGGGGSHKHWLGQGLGKCVPAQSPCQRRFRLPRRVKFRVNPSPSRPSLRFRSSKRPACSTSFAVIRRYQPLTVRRPKDFAQLRGVIPRLLCRLRRGT